MKRIVIVISLLTLGILAGACSAKSTETGKVVKSAAAGNNLNVSLATADGVIKHGNTEFTLSFTEASGKPVEVGAVSLTFHMPQMGTMSEMNESATFTTTNTLGVYRGHANVASGGEWQVKITYDGPAGRGQASFPINAQ